MITGKLCAACRIETACGDVSEMLGVIDALIIARDDWESHADLALPFLRSGISVFVDKPLTLNAAELDAFVPFLRSGKLMSCSGLRYAAELDSMRVREPVSYTHLDVYKRQVNHLWAGTSFAHATRISSHAWIRGAYRQMSWALTLISVIVLWVLFRADSWITAEKIIWAMFNIRAQAGRAIPNLNVYSALVPTLLFLSLIHI